MIYNIIDKLQIENERIVSVWGKDISSILAILYDYLSDKRINIILIPTSSFNMHFKFDIKVCSPGVELSVGSGVETKNMMCMLAHKKDDVIYPVKEEEMKKINGETFKVFDNIIFLNDTGKEAKELSKVTGLISVAPELPRKSYLFINAEDIKKNFSSSTGGEAQKENLINKVLHEYNNMEIVVSDINNLFKENEINVLGKELLNTGANTIHYFIDNRFKQLKKRV